MTTDKVRNVTPEQIDAVCHSYAVGNVTVPLAARLLGITENEFLACWNDWEQDFAALVADGLEREDEWRRVNGDASH